MRELIAGAYLAVERKGKDIESLYMHPRCLFTTNIEPEILKENRAEYTRIRRVNVKPLTNNRGASASRRNGLRSSLSAAACTNST